MSLRKWLVCLFVMGAGLAVVTTRVWSQDDEGAKKHDKKGGPAGGGMPDMAQMAEMMKKCEEAAKPGPNHKVLEHFVGEWNAATRMWMDPSMPPMQTAGKSKSKWVMDGRFVMDEFEGELVMPGPKGEMVKVPFKGMGLTGYDNVKNLYVGSWVDSMTTGLLTMSGSFNPMTKTLLMFGKMDDLASGVYGKTVRYDTKILGEDKHVFTIYDCHAGVDYKVMEITYTRAK